MSVKISNVSLKVDKTSADDKSRVQSATERKKSANETLEEAWKRILSMKNGPADYVRLREVKKAMDDGEIGREPVEEGKKQKKFSKAEALRLYKVLEVSRREARLQEMKDNMPDNYWTITDERRLREFTLLLSKEDEIVFDVETTGIDVWSDHIVGHVITAIKA